MQAQPTAAISRGKPEQARKTYSTNAMSGLPLTWRTSLKPSSCWNSISIIADVASSGKLLIKSVLLGGLSSRGAADAGCTTIPTPRSRDLKAIHLKARADLDSFLLAQFNLTTSPHSLDYRTWGSLGGVLPFMGQSRQRGLRTHLLVWLARPRLRPFCWHPPLA